MEFLREKIKNKIIFGTIIFFLAATFLSSAVWAKYTVPSEAEGISALDEYKQALEEPNVNLPQWSLYNMGYITKGLTRMMVGIPVLEGEQANNGGVAGILAGLIGGIYQNQPVSSGEYLADLGKRLEIVRPAYAQGQGWQFLQPILTIWQGVRNVTYLFFVLIFVAMGFMIMFRKKMDPQTIISIQTAIPKIVVSLLLVTFSYAICGLIVDLIYLANSLLSAVFSPILSTGPWAYRVNVNIFEVAASILGSIIKPLAPVPVLGELGAVFVAIGKALSGSFADLFILVLGFIVISSIFKIFLSLLGRYVMLIVYTIFSPLIFLWGTLPGQSDHIPRFFKSLLGAAITFPVMILLLNFADYFFRVEPAFQELMPLALPGGGIPNPAGGPPITTIQAILPALIGIGIIMTASRLPEIIDDAIGIKPGMGPALGAEAGGALRKIPFIGSLMG